MALPRGDEYNEAVQNPKIAFTDTDLKSSSVENNLLGLPKPYSGGFTITYKLFKPKQAWAVRCFHRDINELQKRYQAIENFLLTTRSPYFVETKYLSEGIKVRGKGYPVIKMRWLEGEPFNIYITRVCQQKAKIEKLLNEFVKLIDELEKSGIAHGDLQHGNIMVKNEKLYLIDYDGMYLPELASLPTSELGHPNYQHPNRAIQDYTPYIDRFSVLIIYIGLKAISVRPDLWHKYDNSENILFKSQDFADLKRSELIQDLSTIPEILPLVKKIITCCYLNFRDLPNLADFLAGNFIAEPLDVSTTLTAPRNPYRILDANKQKSLLEHFGEKVEVVGKISSEDLTSHRTRTKKGAPYMYLTFGLPPKHTFTIALKKGSIPAASLVGKYVSVVGVIGSYYKKPQMIIEQLPQIQVLENKATAYARLAQKSAMVSTQSFSDTATQKVNALLKKFYEGTHPNLPATDGSPRYHWIRQIKLPKRYHLPFKHLIKPQYLLGIVMFIVLCLGMILFISSHWQSLPKNTVEDHTVTNQAHLSIRDQIFKNWLFKQDSSGLTAIVLIRLDINGHIKGAPQIIQSSGNPLFDDSCLSAIAKSDPLQMPEDITARQAILAAGAIEIEFTQTPAQ